MIDWLRQLLPLSPREQLVQIENREPSLEERLERLLARLGRYTRKNADELEEIMADLAVILDIVEKIILALENIGGAERARQLRTRLRRHRTQTLKAYRDLTGRDYEQAVR